MNIENELAELIKSTGISKKKVAELAGVGQDTITRWCKGESPTPKLLLEKLRKINQAVNE